MFRMFMVALLAACSLGASVPAWNNLQGRIVGGVNTTIERHPYQVSLITGNFHNCGGSLIAKNWVLTAGHCIGGQYSVRVGSSTLESGGVVHAVKRQVRHERYNGGTIDYDFGLLELEKPVNLTSQVQLVKLANQGEELKAGTLLNVTGWGATATASSSKQLQLVTVPYVAHEVCNKSYPGQLTDRMFCAGYLGVGGKDSCQGDSGGPVIYNGKQYGVVSWGRGCALPDYPGVYAKVSAQRDWVRNVTGV